MKEQTKIMIISRSAIICFIWVTASSVSTAAQTKTRVTREEYIDRYKSIAVAHMDRYGIPASITMAQGILESDCGNSWLSMQSNNHFGIKCKRNWTGEKIYHDDDAKGECFRQYPSVEASYSDHAEFLDSQPRYDSLFAYDCIDYKSWARGLKAAGYATAPDYAQRLVKIIEDSELFLLDKTDGERLYASRHLRNGGKSPEEWFSGQSSVEQTAEAGELINPDDYRVTINAHNGYNVYRTNNVSYVLAKEGDTFEKISDDFMVSAKNLRKFNDVAKNAQPMTGEIVYIEKKKKRWEGNAMTHTASEGETVFSVAQSYGITSKAIAKRNKLPLTAQFGTGQKIKIR